MDTLNDSLCLDELVVGCGSGPSSTMTMHHHLSESTPSTGTSDLTLSNASHGSLSAVTSPDAHSPKSGNDSMLNV